MKFYAITALLVLILNNSVISDDWNEFKVKRETDFSFAVEPSVTVRDENNYLISFETKSFCDVTIAIENSEGKILRHLVSGVLGPKAPKPLVSNSKKQELLFDGKDDAGEYIRDLSGVVVRVSLGMKVSYEKSLFNDPRRRHSWGRQLMVTRPEGVYIYEGGNGLDFVKLFDFDGKYVKSIYPIDGDQLKKIKDLQQKDLPDKSGKFPVKINFLQTSFLNTGSAYARRDDVDTVFGSAHYGMFGYSASFFAASKDYVTLGMGSVAKISTGASQTDYNLYGPQVGYEILNRKKEKVLVPPNASGMSPDGKTLYLAGYHYCNYGAASADIKTSGDWRSHHMVYEVDLTKNEAPKIFWGDPEKSGNDDKSFHLPINIHVDEEGRVYVCDYFNHRVQIFDKNKKLLKSLPVKHPAFVTVTQKNKEIIVISHAITAKETATLIKDNKNFKIPAEMTRFGTFANAKAQPPIALPKEYQFEVGGYLYAGLGIPASYVIDDTKENLRIWVSMEHRAENVMSRGKIEELNIKIWELAGKEFKLLQDWATEVKKSMALGRPLIFSRERIQYNPSDDHLYMNLPIPGFNGKSFKRLFKMNIDSGAITLIDIPFDAEDFCFDNQGFLYLKSLNVISRYDAATIKEVPWDYGAETSASTSASSDRKVADVISGMKVPTVADWHHGGIYVNLKGNLVFSGPLSTEGDEEAKKTFTYEPKVYQGRASLSKMSHLVHVYNKHGILVKDDVVPGLKDNYGIALDSDNNLYLMNGATRHLNGKMYENKHTGTIMKFTSNGGRVLSEGVGHVMMPLPKEMQPKREKDIGETWVEGAEWFYGGVGFSGKNTGIGCACWNARMGFDYFNRTLAPELERYRVAVIDSSGNLILNIGNYGNRDSAGSQIGLFHGAYLATHSDRRIFIADPGNDRIVVAKVEYNTTKKTGIKKQ